MARHADSAELSLGNHIYLYRLLRDALGCGKQTFLPTVEEALAQDRCTAADLGFESTRALLEALDDFITLTVFKGGRIYATVITQPTWDEALAAPTESKGNGGKSWKRKRGAKALKAVAPRRVKQKPAPAVEARAEQTPASVAEDRVEQMPASASEAETETNASAATATIDNAADNATAEPIDTPPVEPNAEMSTQPIKETATDSSAAPKSTHPEKHARQVPPTELPSSTDVAADASPEAITETPEIQVGANPRPAIDLSRYPKDFATEVFCPGPILSELCALYPLGADAMGIVGEYFYLACDRGDAQLARSRATFPIRYLAAGERKTAQVTIRKQSTARGGLTWAIGAIKVES